MRLPFASRRTIALAMVLSAGVVGSAPNAIAQSQAPSPPTPSASSDNANSGQSTSANDQNGSATEWTYKMQNGQLYQPPKDRPTSPAQDVKVYGDT